MEIVNTILIPFLLLIVFWQAIFDHASNFKGSSRSFGDFLFVLSSICFFIIIAFLITIGIKGKWWIPILLGIGGFILSGIVNSIFTGILGRFREHYVSLLGVICAPVLILIIAFKLWF